MPQFPHKQHRDRNATDILGLLPPWTKRGPTCSQRLRVMLPPAPRALWPADGPGPGGGHWEREAQREQATGAAGAGRAGVRLGRQPPGPALTPLRFLLCDRDRQPQAIESLASQNHQLRSGRCWRSPAGPHTTGHRWAPPFRDVRRGRGPQPQRFRGRQEPAPAMGPGVGDQGHLLLIVATALTLSARPPGENPRGPNQELPRRPEAPPDPPWENCR